MENGRHRVVKHFRFTETEAAKLRKLAKEFNMTESEYIRLLLNNKPSDYYLVTDVCILILSY